MLDATRPGSRAITLRDFVERFEPGCLASNDAETRERWLQSACARLAQAAESLGYPAGAVRGCTFAMLEESSRRLVAARDAATNMAGELDTGILSILVAGSAARGEAIASSDIDFDVYVTASYMETLHSRRDAKAKTAHELLRNYEQKLRLQLEDKLKERLKGGGFDARSGHLSMKPFSAEQLTESGDEKLALLHLLNLVFGAVAVYGTEAFTALIDELLPDRLVQERAILGRIALLSCRSAVVTRESWLFETPTKRPRGGEVEPLAALHAVAASISAIIGLALRLPDPQMPYWYAFEEAGAIVEGPPRRALEVFLARVTVARGAAVGVDMDVLDVALETALAALPPAVDAIIEHLETQGADAATLRVWDAIQQYLLEPRLARQLARETGLC